MAHSHGHHHHGNTKNIGITVFLNIIITITQIIGGVVSGSMALLTDALHNFSDVLSLVISWFAQKLTKKKHTETKTFGFKRAEIFAAFINSLSLFIISGILLWEAAQRIFDEKQINGDIVIWLALLSIIMNGISVLLIKKDAEHSINIKSAYLHLFTDMLTSIAVLAGGLVMKYFQIYWIDSVFSMGIALYLIYASIGIFKESLKILMQFTPENVDLKKISDEIKCVEEIKNIHHIHAWKLDEHDVIFEAHIDVRSDIKISEFEEILKKIDTILDKYQIHHYNIQPEIERCDDKDLINNHLKT